MVENHGNLNIRIKVLTYKIKDNESYEIKLKYYHPSKVYYFLQEADVF